ncbi:MAG: SUMF1/EgtB/PvdO family nonheme iron enzyme [Candidatus Latescibacterota bacterium]
MRLDLTVELGRLQSPLDLVQRIRPQDVIELDKLAGEAFEIRVNGQVFGWGETVVVGEQMACRVTGLNHPTEAVVAAPAPSSSVEDAAQDEWVYISAGPFVMGSSDSDVPAHERPAHSVRLSAYFIGRHPVTNLDYAEFVQATRAAPPPHWPGGVFAVDAGRHPVTHVTWQDAATYARWRGGRLPTEAEWEKAARGTDERVFPWGNRFTEGERCNGANQVATTTPVNEYPDGRSPFGVWDLCGNVYEWCADYYDEGYYGVGPSTDPQGPPVGQWRVVRGGCFRDARSALRVTHRVGLDETTARDTVGFRIAMDA